MSGRGDDAYWRTEDSDSAKLRQRVEDMERAEKAKAELDRFLRGFDGIPTEDLIAGTMYRVSVGKVEKDPVNHQARGAALRQAIDVINGERQDVYGSPEDSFALIARYWQTYLESRPGLCTFMGANPDHAEPLAADDVAMMMTLFKIAREANQHKLDNIVDAAGYLGIYADMQGDE